MAAESTAPAEATAPEGTVPSAPEQPEGLQPLELDEAPEPAGVPYTVFRAAQTAATHQARGGSTPGRVRRNRGRAEAYETQLRERDTKMQEYEAAFSLLRDNADLYEQLMARGEAPTSGASPAARPASRDAAGGALDPETAKAVREAAEYVREEKAYREYEVRQVRLQSLYSATANAVESLMKETGYPEAVIPKLLPHAMKSIITDAQDFPDRGRLEDVPVLFNNWHRANLMLQRHSPATVPQAAPKPAALGSEALKEQAMAFLQSRGVNTAPSAVPRPPTRGTGNPEIHNRAVAFLRGRGW